MSTQDRIQSLEYQLASAERSLRSCHARDRFVYDSIERSIKTDQALLSRLRAKSKKEIDEENEAREKREEARERRDKFSILTTEELRHWICARIPGNKEHCWVYTCCIRFKLVTQAIEILTRTEEDDDV